MTWKIVWDGDIPHLHVEQGDDTWIPLSETFTCDDMRELEGESACVQPCQC
jgi:hypothetical protein